MEGWKRVGVCCRPLLKVMKKSYRRVVYAKSKSGKKKSKIIHFKCLKF